MSAYSLTLGEAVLRRRTRQAEKSARIEAEIATRIKSEFISNMSHELRTPLNTVIGFSKLLAETDRRALSEEDGAEYARLIHDASCNLLAIINDILDISKIQSGHYRLDMTEVDVDEILDAVVAALRAHADQAGVTLTMPVESRAMLVKGDTLKLRQVFANLIGNAIKFTPSGGQVIIEPTVETDGAVNVVVRDTGVGMDNEEIGVALQPFGQVDGKRTRWREGTGLGLPIAKSLIELHGGTLKIESAKSVGTVVSVHLPPPSLISFLQQDLGFQISRS